MPLESALSSIPQKDLEKKEDFPGRRGSPVGKAPLGSRPFPAQKDTPDEPFVMNRKRKNSPASLICSTTQDHIRLRAVLFPPRHRSVVQIPQIGRQTQSQQQRDQKEQKKRHQQTGRLPRLRLFRNSSASGESRAMSVRFHFHGIFSFAAETI